MPMQNLGSFNTVEGYTTQGCHMVANHDFATIPTSQALRTRFLFKREGMLGL
jgi:hypothetical protein